MNTAIKISWWAFAREVTSLFRGTDKENRSFVLIDKMEVFGFGCFKLPTFLPFHHIHRHSAGPSLDPFLNAAQNYCRSSMPIFIPLSREEIIREEHSPIQMGKDCF
jgi:hypothetical protein